MKSTAASPTMPPSEPRTTPPAITTSIDGYTRILLATLMLLVMTISPLWSSSASLTASVVVPILMNSEALSGMRPAAARPIASFSSAAILRRASYSTFSIAGREQRAAMDAGQQPLVA